MVKEHLDNWRKPNHHIRSHSFWLAARDCYMHQRERNVLFNDALNTFYLRLYGVRHMVKDHSDSEKGNPLPPHRLLFPISSKGSFICTIPHTIVHTMAFDIPVVEYWLETRSSHFVNVVRKCFNLLKSPNPNTGGVKRSGLEKGFQ